MIYPTITVTMQMLFIDYEEKFTNVLEPQILDTLIQINIYLIQNNR